ncbi:polysaccharide deacetylase family protein [Algibacter sp. L1A34]|uniref:polysaccharide deacetylase family protein n=1 Tax=Algibacter sp. L1A34 TaxID=2686365 RepID=UPI00131D4EB4|nr:polysaccharide deacetylase family protein [Algibacter sp. L1A34]
MTLTPVKTPFVVKKMFPNYIWDIATNKKIIYLTFDDGPTLEITNWTLDTLKKYNAKATFFCIGNNIEKNPEIFKDIIKHGHAIGNHTQNHAKGWKTSTVDYLSDVEQAEQNIQKEKPQQHTSTSKSVKLFRPPYGKIRSNQGKQIINLGYKIIMWDILSFDWEHKISKETCFKNVISKTKNGSIVVFHDSVKASRNMQYTLPKVLKHFSEQGFIFKSLDFKA